MGDTGHQPLALCHSGTLGQKIKLKNPSQCWIYSWFLLSRGVSLCIGNLCVKQKPDGSRKLGPTQASRVSGGPPRPGPGGPGPREQTKAPSRCQMLEGEAGGPPQESGSPADGRSRWGAGGAVGLGAQSRADSRLSPRPAHARHSASRPPSSAAPWSQQLLPRLPSGAG